MKTLSDLQAVLDKISRVPGAESLQSDALPSWHADLASAEPEAATALAGVFTVRENLSQKIAVVSAVAARALEDQRGLQGRIELAQKNLERSISGAKGSVFALWRPRNDQQRLQDDLAGLLEKEQQFVNEQRERLLLLQLGAAIQPHLAEAEDISLEILPQVHASLTQKKQAIDEQLAEGGGGQGFAHLSAQERIAARAVSSLEAITDRLMRQGQTRSALHQLDEAAIDREIRSFTDMENALLQRKEFLSSLLHGGSAKERETQVKAITSGARTSVGETDGAKTDKPAASWLSRDPLAGVRKKLASKDPFDSECWELLKEEFDPAQEVEDALLGNTTLLEAILWRRASASACDTDGGRVLAMLEKAGTEHSVFTKGAFISKVIAHGIGAQMMPPRIPVWFFHNVPSQGCPINWEAVAGAFAKSMKLKIPEKTRWYGNGIAYSAKDFSKMVELAYSAAHRQGHELMLVRDPDTDIMLANFTNFVGGACSAGAKMTSEEGFQLLEMLNGDALANENGQKIAKKIVATIGVDGEWLSSERSPIMMAASSPRRKEWASVFRSLDSQVAWFPQAIQLLDGEGLKQGLCERALLDFALEQQPRAFLEKLFARPECLPTPDAALVDLLLEQAADLPIDGWRYLGRGAEGALMDPAMPEQTLLMSVAKRGDVERFVALLSSGKRCDGDGEALAALESNLARSGALEKEETIAQLGTLILSTRKISTLDDHAENLGVARETALSWGLEAAGSMNSAMAFQLLTDFSRGGPLGSGEIAAAIALMESSPTAALAKALEAYALKNGLAPIAVRVGAPNAQALQDLPEELEAQGAGGRAPKP